MASKEPDENGGRLKQIRLAYQMTKKSDPRVGLIVAAYGLLVFAVVLAVGFWWGHPVYLGILGALLGLLVAAIMFGRRAEKAVLGQMEGQPGAGAAVLNSLKRGWVVTPGVAADKAQNMVHRAVGRPGIVLVAEGRGVGVRQLLTKEKKKMARVADGVVVHDIVIGDDEAAGQVPLKKLQRHIMKLPVTMTKQQVGPVNDRLRALGDLLSNMPLPKGPMPKGARMPRGPR
jgi:hypothetical protein